MGKLIDLTGQQFGELTVIERDFNYPLEHGLTLKAGAYWKCQCSCNNIITILGRSLRSGHTKTCGKCSNDLTGQVFGELTVLQRNFVYAKEHQLKDNKKTYWDCLCSCGKRTTVVGRDLRNGHTQSCGHLWDNLVPGNNKLNLTNQIFGHLQALYPTEERSSTSVKWHCKCLICGNEKNISAYNLTTGITQTCGCIKSIGEFNIQKLLQENDIKFEKEKTFDDLINKETQNKFRYDFYLPDYNRLIEFDGEQHFVYSDNGWNTKEKFEKTQQFDKIKNEYALSHNIPLVRIPYWERDKITLETIFSDKYLI